MKLILHIFLLVLASTLFAQEADSLVIADFEDEAAGLEGWTGSIGDGYLESNWAADPTGNSVGALEVLINTDDGTKGGFANPNLSVIVDGDTASALVIYVYMYDDYPVAGTGDGVQIFGQPRTDWQWQSHWYNATDLTLDAWNRLEFNIDEVKASAPTFDVSQGLQAGVEFVLAEGTSWSDVVYADNIMLLGVSGTTNVETKGYQQPESFSLENYPNPFNPVTKIYYTLPREQYVTLAIYDATGRLVQTLVQNERQPAGRHAFRFDASNLSSGIYFYRLTSGEFSQTRKMSLIQ